MNRAQRNALQRLAETPSMGAPFYDIPNGTGHLPIGRNRVLEVTLLGLRSRGLVDGVGGGQWWITDAGLAALEQAGH